MPRYKYLDEFRPLAAKHPMLSFLFPSSRQITSALGALNAAHLGLSEASSDGSICFSPDEEEKPPVLCLVLGDGRDPRTAILAAIQQRWFVVAIDPDLDAKWEKPRELLPDGCRFMGFRGSMARFLAEGYEMVQSSLCPIADIQHLVIVCVEQGANFDQLKSLRGRLGLADLRVLFNNAPSTVVSISSDDILHECPLKSPPIHCLVDQDILASNRRIQVWNFQSSRKPSTSCTSVKSSSLHTIEPTNMFSPHKPSIPRILSDESIHTRSKSPGGLTPSTSSRRGSNSKVAQLQRQQELAHQNRMQLSAMRIPDQKLELARHTSAAGTDDTSLSSSKSDRDESPPSSGKPPRASVKKGLSRFVRIRRVSLPPKKKDTNSPSSRRKTICDKTELSGHLLQAESKDSIMSFHSAPARESLAPDQVCLSILSKRSSSVSPPPVRDILLHFTGVVPPSSMPRSATERHARIHDKMSVPCDDTNLCAKPRAESTSDPSSSIRTESTSNSTLHEADSDLPKTHSRPTRITPHDFKAGDIVEVKVDNLYQVGMVESQPFKGVYNVTLFSDTPAWNEKRSHVDIYQHSPERMPEVLARDMRPFTPAPMGEIIFVFVNGSERKCCVHGYSYDGSEELSPSHMKYVVKFAKKDGEWRHEKHRVPVQRAYRKVYAV
ncbi:hypothetical protein HJC23_004144 [Cyclotella cryptica]|uniref:Uncharacterized protein n=1 Tax=Cyclotella cryptica TaxID=29204 RepID=A0ABD3PGP1_9STRA|eukprot:CCRYP_014684-RA/>CCRYP_014684-RA protein AED:0.00 eAED:0.00 QI:98/-1/1/1/-1/1/1/342/663